MYEQHLKGTIASQLASEPFICPCCWYEASSRLTLLNHVAATHAQFFTQPAPCSWQAPAKTQGSFEEQQDASRTMVQVAMEKLAHPASSIAKKHRPAVTELQGCRTGNPLKIFIQNILTDSEEISRDENVNEPEVDHSLSAQIWRWCENTGTKPGVVLGYPERHRDAEEGRGGSEEPEGLRTLAPRHALTMQESARLNLSSENTITATDDSNSTAPSHTWLCDGRLLHLTDAISPANLPLFQYQWARGQPVLISNSNRYLDHRLWHPRAFLKDFGHLRSDLVNTLTGKTVPQQPLKWFWEGFNSVSHRLVDASGTPMLLKLKDWPPDGDIAEYIPKRLPALVHDFPIRPYTLREGSLNLASYMPDYLLRPELGPKMYSAYGNALYSNRASTNLHLDMSDAVNLLVYVGLPDDCDAQENIKLVLQQVSSVSKENPRKKSNLQIWIRHFLHFRDRTKNSVKSFPPKNTVPVRSRKKCIDKNEMEN